MANTVFENKVIEGPYATAGSVSAAGEWTASALT